MEAIKTVKKNVRKKLHDTNDYGVYLPADTSINSNVRLQYIKKFYMF